jgi:hypothetical protein
MGVLVKTAQMVEDQVEVVRQQFEPRVRLKLREAKAKWFELRSRRGNAPIAARAELLFRAFLLRTDERLKLRIARLIGRLILQLDRVRRSLAPEGV